MWRRSTHYPLAEAVRTYQERDFRNLIKSLLEYNVEQMDVDEIIVDTEIDLRQMILDSNCPKPPSRS